MLKKDAHCNENPIYVFLFWELRGLSTNFHFHVSVSVLYILRIGPHVSCSRIGRRSGGYINRSQTHECGNWDCGRAIPFLGIFVSNFRYWFFAVQHGGALCAKCTLYIVQDKVYTHPLKIAELSVCVCLLKEAGRWL